MTTIMPPPPGTTDIDAYIAEQLATVRTKEFNPDQPRDEQGRWTDGGGEPRELTVGERLSVEDYAGGGYLDVNELLRRNKVTEAGTRAQIEDQIAQMDSAIAAQPPSTQEKVLYRGASKVPLKPGAVFRDKGFISTSKDSDQAFKFGATLMEIHVPAGSKMLDVGNMAKFDKEQEVILPRGSTFKVEGVHNFRPAFSSFDYPVVKVSLQP